ncbi:GTP-binding protein [Ktedonosporobacter rubrisoli]|uniref:GTP-binding protein n=1 Tax=Ktedonosporobacter rubrisoli TaxID=2509675 RepID=A0A4P6JSN8_KTERU|nr:GTPase [Ktedonosporobacter rubrisoli]QBD78242.1 GTP-binding protein [Ktedonosporobacter rubrisoli]
MASKKRDYTNTSNDEQQQKVQKDLIASAVRRSNRPRTMRELGISALKNLPANISMVQDFMKAVNWKQAQQDVLQGLNNTVVLVGQPNSGKSTLFNKLKGQMLSPTSPEAGTTRTLVRTDFGPFTLVDTPGHLPNVMESGMDQASVIVFLIDATKGLQPDDRELYGIIKMLKKPTIVAVNKVDALKEKGAGDRLATQIAVQFGLAGVMPISGKTGENITEELIPAIIDASPEAALAIGRELPDYRRMAAQRIIRNATLVSLAAGIEPIPLIDIPVLLGTQVRLVLRLAALYGEALDSADAMKHARELIVTLLGGLGMRYLAQQAAKAVPFGGDFIAGAIAGAATWSIGEVALEYYEGGKRINPRRLRSLYGSFYRFLRRGGKVEEINNQLKEGKAEALLEEPGEQILEEGTA